MYAPPQRLPDDPVQLRQVLEQELGSLAGLFQNLADGKLYPYTKGGKAQFWDDYVSSFMAGKSTGPNQPTWATLRNGISAYSFSATAMNELWLEPIHLTHTIKPGSAIYPHIHWTTTGTNTGVVRWGIEYTLAKGHNQEAFPASTTIYLEQAASGTAYQHMIVEASDVQAITASIEPDTLLLCRVFRDGGNVADTCTDAAFGIMLDVHYQIAHWGTRNKAPNFYGN